MIAGRDCRPDESRERCPEYPIIVTESGGVSGPRKLQRVS